MDNGEVDSELEQEEVSKQYEDKMRSHHAQIHQKPNMHQYQRRQSNQCPREH